MNKISEFTKSTVFCCIASALIASIATYTIHEFVFCKEDALEVQVDQLNPEIQQNQEKYSQLEESYIALQQQSQNCAAQFQSISNEMSVLQDKCNRLTNDYNVSIADKDALTQAFTQLQTLYNALRTENANILQQYNLLQVQMTELNTNTQAQITDLKRYITALNTQIKKPSSTD